MTSPDLQTTPMRATYQPDAVLLGGAVLFAGSAVWAVQHALSVMDVLQGRGSQFAIVFMLAFALLMWQTVLCFFERPLHHHFRATGRVRRVVRRAQRALFQRGPRGPCAPASSRCSTRPGPRTWSTSSTTVRARRVQRDARLVRAQRATARGGGPLDPSGATPASDAQGPTSRLARSRLLPDRRLRRHARHGTRSRRGSSRSPTAVSCRSPGWSCWPRSASTC